MNDLNASVEKNIENILEKDEGKRKKILSIDGGGIRGIISAEILVKIEEALEKYNPKWKCLADFFDLIGGTSTGSIIAAGLAKGMKAKDILELYKNLGKSVFKKNWYVFYDRSLYSKYDSYPLKKFLEEHFKEITLGSDELKTNLIIPTKNMTLGRNYIFSNIKNINRDVQSSNYFVENEDNTNIKLKDIILASSAAPTYFSPHKIKIGTEYYEFIDGAIGMYNNPAFLLFREAINIREDYHDQGKWLSKPENLLLVSVGNGFYDLKVDREKGSKYWIGDWGRYVTNRMIEDANISQNHLLKLISYEPNQWNKNTRQVEYNSLTDSIRKRAENSEEKLLKGKRLTYFRFNLKFERDRFNQLGLDTNNIEALERLDCIDQIERLSKIGQKVAEEQFQINRFEPFLS